LWNLTFYVLNFALHFKVHHHNSLKFCRIWWWKQLPNYFSNLDVCMQINYSDCSSGFEARWGLRPFLLLPCVFGQPPALDLLDLIYHQVMQSNFEGLLYSWIFTMCLSHSNLDEVLICQQFKIMKSKIYFSYLKLLMEAYMSIQKIIVLTWEIHSKYLMLVSKIQHW
jgi:hypothetical protein